MKVKVPIKELRELFLAVADMCDRGDDTDVPDYVDEAYNALLLTPWAKKVYSDAVEIANARLR